MAALALGISVVAASLCPPQAAAAGAKSAIQAGAHPAPRHPGRRSLEQRVTMLSKALGLDAGQQSELRKVLERQREQISRVWRDTAVPAAYRVSATQAISEKTADQIRALLNDEQRKRYNPRKPPHKAGPGGSGRPSVEAWMYPAKAAHLGPGMEVQDVGTRSSGGR
jgi:hypothetical protein